MMRMLSLMVLIAMMNMIGRTGFSTRDLNPQQQINPITMVGPKRKVSCTSKQSTSEFFSNHTDAAWKPLLCTIARAHVDKPC